MLDDLKLAKMQGYYVPDLEYVIDPPPVCTAWWLARDWVRYVSRWFALEVH
jgi:hypothetical protein